MPILSEEVNLSTTLDEYAAEIFISRKPGNETLEEFNERVIVGHKNLYNSGPEAFLISLDYITNRRTKNICELTISTENEEELISSKIEVVEGKLILTKGAVVEEYNFEDYKFVYNLIKALNTSNILTPTIKEDYEIVKFEKTKNILKTSSSKKYLGFESNDSIIKLPVSNVVRVLNQKNMEEVPYIRNTKEIFNTDEEMLKLIIEYIEMPVVLQWNHFFIVECNSDTFKSMLKDTNGFLTSEGGRLVNKILEKQNTYWG
jgi:hypothetical protein